jgi:glycerol-3-phosphate O-acyltransferase
MRKEDRERAVVEVVSRVVEQVREEAQRGGPAIEDVLADTLYEETQRLKRAPRDRVAKEQRRFYRGLKQQLLKGSVTEQVELLRQSADRFAREVVGHFDPRVYAFTTRLLPVGAGLMVKAVSPLSLLSQLPDLPNLRERVLLSGATDTIRSLAKRGTVILAPTHLSNLDSIILGYGLFLLGLPPFTYGAGLNLFTNPLLSFFMHNLGAYKVDRRKQADLYKRVLKEYATVSMEYGYHNLFFPGGTRSRSGAVEQRLKLGLLGCGLRAFVNNLRRKVSQPDVFIVPCTLSYGLVLEARTLISDHLAGVGKSRFIIEDDESSRPRQILDFARKLISLDARIVMRLSEPLDVFGNRVLADGTSVDGRGRPVDTSRYVLTGDRPGFDPQRDAEYTREAGQAVTRVLRQDATYLSTHQLAFATFALLRARSPEKDLFRFLRTAGELGGVSLDDVYPAVARLCQALRRLGEQGRIADDAVPFGKDPQSIVSDGLRYFGTYHEPAVIQRRGDRLFPGDMKLLYYYRNRLDGLELDPVVAPSPSAEVRA